jgi:hypothetical protein
MLYRLLFLGIARPPRRGNVRPAHERFGQAEPPGPVTCMVYIVVAGVLLGGFLFIALKAGGWI